MLSYNLYSVVYTNPIQINCFLANPIKSKSIGLLKTINWVYIYPLTTSVSECRSQGGKFVVPGELATLLSYSVPSSNSSTSCQTGFCQYTSLMWSVNTVQSALGTLYAYGMSPHQWMRFNDLIFLHWNNRPVKLTVHN